MGEERYITKHFILEELVNPKVISDYGNFGWDLLDEGLLKVLDHLREVFGSCKVNDYVFGGGYINSGLRVDWGSPTSAHREGMAFDLKFKKATVTEVYDYIIANQEMLYEMGLRRVENINFTPTWLHIDSKEKIGKEGMIYTFRP